MNADLFTRRWLMLFAVLAALVVISPWFIHVVVGNSGCKDGGATACGQMSEVLTLYARRLILGIFLTLLLIAAGARALTIGAFLWAMPFALLMAAGAAPLYFDAAVFAADGTQVDWLASAGIMPLLFLVLLLVALSAYPDDVEGGTPPAWRAALGFVAIAAAFVTAPAWSTGLTMVPWIGAYAYPVGHMLAQGHAALGIEAQLAQLASYCVIAFVLGSAGLVMSGRRPAPPLRVARR